MVCLNCFTIVSGCLGLVHIDLMLIRCGLALKMLVTIGFNRTR